MREQTLNKLNNYVKYTLLFVGFHLLLLIFSVCMVGKYGASVYWFATPIALSFPIVFIVAFFIIEAIERKERQLGEWRM